MRSSEDQIPRHKLEKDIKFVAHDATIASDFMINFALYMESLHDIINNSLCSAHLIAQARGFFAGLKDECTLLDIRLLTEITRILERFSTEFQVSALRVDSYINLVGQLKCSLKELSVESPTPATQYFFAEYFAALTEPLLMDSSQRTSRGKPTVGEGLIEGRVQALQDRKSVHQDFINELSTMVEHYWFDHHYWKRELTNITRIKNLGRFLNSIGKSLDITVPDPVKPSHTRCSECNKLVSVKKINILVPERSLQSPYCHRNSRWTATLFLMHLRA